MIQIGTRPATIEAPLEHLMACHRRIEDRLATLERAAEFLHEGCEEALDAIRKSILFLESSGALHTLDEEDSLFPRLRPHLTREEQTDLDRLEEQHVEAESVFRQLKEAVAELTASPTLAIRELRYRELVTRLAALFRPHIQFEDAVMTPIARRVLNSGELELIAEEMRLRRKTAQE